MRSRRAFAALVTMLSLTAGILAVAASPAQAGIPGLARANVVFAGVFSGSTPIGVQACMSGTVDDAPFFIGEFAITLVAVRSNGSQFIEPGAFPAPSFLHCRTIYFDNTPYGSVDVVVTYGGAGVDVVTLAWGVAAWSPSTNGATWVSFGV